MSSGTAEIIQHEPGSSDPASMNERELRHAHVGVSAPVVEQISVTPLHQALYENDIRYLTDGLPFLLGREQRLIGPRQQFARVSAVKDGNSSPIHQLVV